MKHSFAREIEKWYAEKGRQLPWRETKDAYRIWVSEIILQQTRVAQGMDYYHRFISRFPTVGALAQATEDEVLRMWQGLGYYSRARNMHKAARQIMDGGGVFPREYEEVRRLSGIGDYTAAAIMSFAYDKPHAVVDGNVFRILSRTQGVDTPIDSTQGRKLFTALAQELLDKRQPALYNQAIMDFGALQCLPKGTDCEPCPLRLQCAAYREKRVEQLPVKAHKTAVRDRYLIYIYIHEPRFLLLHRRGEGDIWQGLYELPLHEVEKAQTGRQFPDIPWLRQILETDGSMLTLRATDVRHQLSHQTLHVDFYELSLPEGGIRRWLERQAGNAQWDDMQMVQKAQLDSYALPKLILQLLQMTH